MNIDRFATRIPIGSQSIFGRIPRQFVGKSGSGTASTSYSLTLSIETARRVETISATDIRGKSWPKDELVHFEVDVENGEVVTEIGVSDAGVLPASYVLPFPITPNLRVDGDYSS